MKRELALIAEGGGMRGAYVYGAMQALEEVFNDQHGLANFAYMSGVSASALTMMYTLSGQFHSDGLEIWSNKVAQRRFLDEKNLKRLFVGPSILDVAFLVDEIFQKQHPLAWNNFKNTPCRFYIPLLDVDDLELKFYTNDTEVSSALLPYEMLFMDRNNPGELYSMMKAAAGAPVFFNHEVEIQGRRYVDPASLMPFPLTAPIPSSAKRVCILTKPEAPGGRWFRDRFFPSVAKSGFFHGNISNPNIYSLSAEEHKNYKALLEQLEALEQQQDAFIIRPAFEMSSSDNRPETLKRNREAGFQDVICQKEALQSFLVCD
jgi:predicted patatin/cPLA2 family phospholipase